MDKSKIEIDPKVITWAVVVPSGVNPKFKRLLKNNGFGYVFHKNLYFRHAPNIDKAKESIKALGTNFSFLSFCISDEQFGKIHIQHAIRK